MKTLQHIVLPGLFVFMLNPIFTMAQTADKQPSVKISGEVTTPLDLKVSDLNQFDQTKVTRKDKDGKDHIYGGVLLSALLQKAGATLGKELKGRTLTSIYRLRPAMVTRLFLPWPNWIKNLPTGK